MVRTTDGGRTWTVATLEADDLLDVSFVSATTGWALGRRDDPVEATDSTSVLFHTTDGGATWTAQKTWTATRLRAVGFADETTGWLVGDGARIEHTSDGGVTWTTQKVDTELALETLCVVDASTVWAAGEIVIETSDGGATWESRSNLDVYADTFSGVALLARTAAWWPPAGTTPTRKGRTSAPPSPAAPTAAPRGPRSTRRTTSTAPSRRSPSARAAESAPSVPPAPWCALPTAEPPGAGREPQGARMLEGIDFVDALHGWAVGLYFTPEAPSSLVLRTSDGGATWREAIFEKGSWSSALSDVEFVSAKVGCAVGDAGLVLRSGRRRRRLA